MLVNRQDFSLALRLEDGQTYVNQRADFSWRAGSLSLFKGLTYLGEASDPSSSWWIDTAKSIAFRIKNVESAVGENIVQACGLTDHEETSHAHILCHLQDFEGQDG